jgi:hypothetical protein
MYDYKTIVLSSVYKSNSSRSLDSSPQVFVNGFDSCAVFTLSQIVQFSFLIRATVKHAILLCVSDYIFRRLALTASTIRFTVRFPFTTLGTHSLICFRLHPTHNCNTRLNR